MRKRILVVDDDRKLRDLLVRFLTGEGYEISCSANSKEAETTLDNEDFQLIVMDVMMPGEDGVSFTGRLKQYSDIPVLMLTAMGEAEDRIKGLEHGADDYLAKPFEPRELVLRIRKLLERNNGVRTKIITFGNYKFDMENGELKQNNLVASLSSTESSLLMLLAENINRSVSREDISKTLNGISERSVDVQVTRLRKKIEKNPSDPVYIVTSRGKGYMLRG